MEAIVWAGKAPFRRSQGLLSWKDREALLDLMEDHSVRILASLRKVLACEVAASLELMGQEVGCFVLHLAMSEASPAYQV
jgi:hypothetical protein